MSRIRYIKKWCKDHLASSLIVTAIFSWFIGWSLSWIVPSPAVLVKNFPEKELTCTLNAGLPLFSQALNDDHFQILFEGDEIKEPWIYNITIANTGEEPILVEDYIEPFTINFENITRLVKASVIESSNQSLSNEFLQKASIEGTILKIKSLFLNPGDALTINVITEGKAGVIQYGHRTAGVPHINIRNLPEEKLNQINSVNRMALIGVAVLLIIIIVIIFYLILSFKKTNKVYRELEQKYSEYLELSKSISGENNP